MEEMIHLFEKWDFFFFFLLLTILLLNSIPATTKGVTPAVKFININNKNGNSHQSFQDSRGIKERDLYLGKWGRLYTIPKAPTIICQVISTCGAESEEMAAETSATADVLSLNFLFLIELLTQFLKTIIFWLDERFRLNFLLVWCFGYGYPFFNGVKIAAVSMSTVEGRTGSSMLQTD